MKMGREERKGIGIWARDHRKAIEMVHSGTGREEERDIFSPPHSIQYR